MKQKLDFIIYDEQDEQLVFRFYPRRSHCHSFNEKPPQSSEEVFKVYYAYSILKQWKREDGSIECTEVMYEESFDECSVIDTVSECCEKLSNGITEEERHLKLRNKDYSRLVHYCDTEYYPLGDGTSWLIHPSTKQSMFKIEVWSSDDKGFRFWLSKEKLKQFGEYLNMCCEYMLKHGEPI